MSRIEISEPLELPPSDVLTATDRIMTKVEAHLSPYDSLSLRIYTEHLKLPVYAEMRVPVSARVERHVLRWETHLEIGSANNPDFFPRFDGTLSVDPEGHAASRLWLRGMYEPPLGFLEDSIDATVLRGVAELSLKDFLRWIAGEVSARVRESEQHLAWSAQWRHC